jgi:hypothetical protein
MSSSEDTTKPTFQTLFDNIEVGSMRNFNGAESNVMPLILQRSPQQYLRSCSLFLVPSNHSHYNDLIQLINNWYSDINKGDTIKVDFTSKFDIQEFDTKKWYFLDLRSNPDSSFSNSIQYINHDKVSKHAFNRMSFMIYEKVKSVVVFADGIDEVPEVFKSLCILCLASPSIYQLTASLINVGNETPKNVAVTTLNNGKNNTQLYGCHKFEPMPVFVSWPPALKQ